MLISPYKLGSSTFANLNRVRCRTPSHCAPPAKGHPTPHSHAPAIAPNAEKSRRKKQRNYFQSILFISNILELHLHAGKALFPPGRRPLHRIRMNGGQKAGNVHQINASRTPPRPQVDPKAVAYS